MPTTSGNASSKPMQKPKMPDKPVKAGDFRLHLLSEGKGSPTVILDAGFSSSAVTLFLHQSVQSLHKKSSIPVSFL